MRRPPIRSALVLYGLTLLAALVPVIRLHAAIGVTEKLQEAQTADNDASWTSVGTFTIANNALGICVVLNTATSANLRTPTLTGGSVTTWTAISNVSFDTVATSTVRLTAFRGLGSGAAAAAVTADYAAVNQTSVSWNCWEFTNTIITGTNAADAIGVSGTNNADNAGSITVSLAALGSPQILLMAGGVNAANTWTPDTGFSVGTEITNSTPTSELKIQYLANGTDNSPTWSFSGTPHAGAIAFEIKETGWVAAGTGAKRGLLLGIGE